MKRIKFAQETSVPKQVKTRDKKNLCILLVQNYFLYSQTKFNAQELIEINCFEKKKSYNKFQSIN